MTTPTRGKRRTAAPPPDAFTPPSDIGAEQSVLGAMMIGREAVDAVAEILTAADFYRPGHGVVFEAVCDMAARDLPVDFITAQDELTQRGQLETVGGPSYLAALLNVVPTMHHAEYYARIVRRMSRRRAVIEAAQEAIGLALTDTEDAEALMDRAVSLMSNAAEGGSSTAGHSVPLSEVMMEAWDAAEANAERGGGMTGLPTEYAEFDRMTNGLQPTDLVIVAARPSMGKTSLALNIAERNALSDSRRGVTLIFSLEMSRRQLMTRMMSTGAMVQSQTFRSGVWTADEASRMSGYARRAYSSRIRIDDRTGVTPQAVRRECRRVQRHHGLDLIVVDYLQLMEPDRYGGNRSQEVDSIIKALKNLAREFRVPVVVLSQLSRAVESRPNKRPMLSDLRESGGIEAEADLVCFLYRQAYYDQKEQYGEGQDTTGEAKIEETELIVAKHRNGPTGMVKLGFIPQFACFQDWKD